MKGKETIVMKWNGYGLKRLLAILLCVLMVTSNLGVTAFAEGDMPTSEETQAEQQAENNENEDNNEEITDNENTENTVVRRCDCYSSDRAAECPGAYRAAFCIQ